jgi:hypothetical protein
VSDPQSKPSSARPSKVTLAASLGGVSCVVLIFSLFDTLTRLRGVEMRDEITKSLSEPPFDTLAASTADVLAVMRVMAFFAGGLAAAGAVLAVFVARRHQGARVGFSVIAALLLLTTPVAGMLTFLVGIAAVLLWSEPSRAWFSGRDPARSQADRRQEVLMSAGKSPQDGPPGASGWPYGATGPGSDEGSSEPGRDVPPAPPSTAAPPWSSQPPQPPQSDSPQPPPYPGAYGAGQEQSPGEGAPPAEPPPTQPQQPQQPWSAPAGSGQQAPYGQPYGQQPYGQPYGSPYGQPYGSPYGQAGYPGQARNGDKRPGTVTTAAVLTMVGAALGLLSGVILMAGLSIDPGTLGDEIQADASFQQLGWDLDQVLAALWVTAVILVGWSLSAMVLAIFTLRRHQWARWLLVGSATATALLSLVAIASIISFLPLVLAVVTVILLFTGGANAWFSGRDPRTPPSGPQWSSTPGPW